MNRTIGMMTLALAGIGSVAGAATTQFAITGAVAAGQNIRTVADANNLLAGTTPNTNYRSGASTLVNFADPQSPGNPFTYHFGGKTPFIIDTPAVDNNFAIRADGNLLIPTSGYYTFGVNSDDGFSLKVGSFSIAQLTQRPAADTLGSAFFAAGVYPLDLVYFQNLGASEVELYAAPGQFPAFNTPGANFQLVNGTGPGALQLTTTAAVPEPASVGLLALAAASLLPRRRR